MKNLISVGVINMKDGMLVNCQWGQKKVGISKTLLHYIVIGIYLIIAYLTTDLWLFLVIGLEFPWVHFLQVKDEVFRLSKRVFFIICFSKERL